jgi:uncharacterized protein (TIGR04222 family)
MKFLPFDLTGPQFLVFYPIFALGVAVLVRYLFSPRDATREPVPPRLTDPYRIALLRDGRREAVRIAVLSLVERGLLTLKPDGSIRVTEDAPESLGDPLEHAVLRFFSGGRPWAPVAEAPAVKAATTAIQSELEAHGLLSTAEKRGSKMAPAVVIPLAVVLLRIHLSEDHPHLFLLLEVIACAILACFITDQRLTPLGRSTLEHLQALFGQARSRGRDLTTQAGSTDVTLLLAATFGITALSEVVAGQPEWLRSKIASMHETFDVLRTKRKDEGGCGGGCGGDGCGGCGGCGGD